MEQNALLRLPLAVDVTLSVRDERNRRARAARKMCVWGQTARCPPRPHDDPQGRARPMPQRVADDDDDAIN